MDTRDRAKPTGDYEKPKRDYQTEQMLRQFLNNDGPKGNSRAYQEGWDRIFSAKRCLGCGVGVLDGEPAVCADCWPPEEP